ncbi:hypothetical protein NEIRO03_2393, partial [Nematocida sp. AWRm78]
MVHIKKRYIMFGMAWIICLNIVICSNLKIKSQISKTKRIFPYESAVSQSSNGYTQGAINEENPEGQLENSNISLFDLIDQANFYTPSSCLEEFNKKSNEVDCFNNIEELFMQKDNRNNEAKANSSPSTDNNQEFIHTIESESFNINACTSSASNDSLLAIYKKQNMYIVRNYTRYKTCTVNLTVHVGYDSIKSDKLRTWAEEEITKWRENTKENIWMMTCPLKADFYRKTRLFSKMLKMKGDRLNDISNPSYYNEFLEDLVSYMNVYGSTIYFSIKGRYDVNKTKQETIGDILANKEVSLYCCCSGMDRQIIEGAERDIKETEEDIKLKKKLNIILLIPEIYEDFYKIQKRIIDEFIKNKSKNNVNLVITQNLFSSNKLYTISVLNIKHIILYFIGTVQKDKNLIEQSYNIIKKIVLDKKNLFQYNTIEVYSLVHSIIQKFYEEFVVIYKLTQVEKKLIKNRTPCMHICINDKYLYRTLGVCTIKIKKYITTRIMLNKKSSNDNLTLCSVQFNSIFKNTIVLRIKDHYHVQFVDNVHHTIEIIHLPFYIYKKEDGTVILQQFHNINSIIVHLKTVFNIGRKKNNLKKGNVYPFKYNIKKKAWSLITSEKDRRKTVQMLETENCNVVFYYIKECIKKTKFCLAQFVCPPEIKDIVNDENIDKPRIPLFLSKFMVSGSALGPYDESVISYKV